LNAGCWQDEPPEGGTVIDGATGEPVAAPRRRRNREKTWADVIAEVLGEEADDVSLH
jgi:hypothetical protein